MTDPLNHLIRSWTRAGAGFNAKPSKEPPDLERLLLATARYAHQAARLFIMAATWLNQYGDLIAKHRLSRLILTELERHHRPALGLLLDVAQQGTHPKRFATVIRLLKPAADPQPLFAAQRAHAPLAARAKATASDISKKWNLWCGPIEFKPDALRPPHWIMARNPDFIHRADFRGDLRASILATLTHDPAATTSELALARTCGGSRAQVRAALANLEMTGRVKREQMGRGNGIILAKVSRVGTAHRASL